MKRLEIVDNRIPKDTKINKIKDIPIGTPFSGTIDDNSSIYLRTGSGVVDLHDPDTTYDSTVWTVYDYYELDATLIINKD